MPGMSKAELFEVVVNAVGESGWNVLYIAPPSTHPFHMQIYRGEEGYRLRIYIWTLTHGGGRARPADEYRIQITGVDQIQATAGEKTLLLGWWEKRGVFAGFDVRRHSGPLGRSLSIQIRRPCLERWHRSLHASAPHQSPRQTRLSSHRTTKCTPRPAPLLPRRPSRRPRAATPHQNVVTTYLYTP